MQPTINHNKTNKSSYPSPPLRSHKQPTQLPTNHQPIQLPLTTQLPTINQIGVSGPSRRCHCSSLSL